MHGGGTRGSPREAAEGAAGTLPHCCGSARIKKEKWLPWGSAAPHGASRDSLLPSATAGSCSSAPSTGGAPSPWSLAAVQGTEDLLFPGCCWTEGRS